MATMLQYLFGKVTRDRNFNFHKDRCRMRNRRFTVIDNNAGLKVFEGYVKYCPCCGEKLDGRK